METDGLVQECKYEATQNKYFVSINCTITKETAASNIEDAEDEVCREIEDCFKGAYWQCVFNDTETEES